jgi:diguanylate cyclase (GGDEF)-like protein
MSDKLSLPPGSEEDFIQPTSPPYENPSPSEQAVYAHAFELGKKMWENEELKDKNTDLLEYNKVLEDDATVLQEQRDQIYDDFLAVAQNKERQIAKLEKENKIDSLTGLLNKEGLEQAYDQFVSLHQRRHPTNTAAGVIIFGDLDWFKEINDLLGHGDADKLLAVVGKKMTEVLRSTDIVGRFGGDEFIVMLPDLNLDRGIKVAEKLLEQIKGNYFSTEGKSVSVSMSMGVDIIDHTVDFRTTYRDANRAMLDAKKQHEKGQIIVVKHDDEIDLREPTK